MSSSVDDLIQQIQSLEGRYREELQPLATDLDVRSTQARFVKKGPLSELMAQIGKLAPADKKRIGVEVNRIKELIEAETERKLKGLRDYARRQDLDRVVDVTMPGRPVPVGHLHILTQVRREMESIFAELGFSVAVGPQVEDDFHNFEALAMPKDHPARDAQDTFYCEGDALLRTHTSPVQIRTMMAQKPPVRIIAPGLVYRRDDDATHSPMFMQIEGLVVDEGVSLGDLKGVLLHFVRRFFGKSTLGIRFRASYFPFVEPGAEVDVECVFCTGPDPACRVCKGSGWLEIGGSGMVDPRVFAQVGIDAERYTGFAFGMGPDRMAMLRHGVGDISHYYNGDVRFLRQF